VTRHDAAARLEAIARDLERDIELAQTRDQHVRLCGRLADVRALAAELSAAA
jgi:hypothetical protein